MQIFGLIFIVIIFCIFWYINLYKILTNLNNKEVIKRSVIDMCVLTIINIVLLLFAIIICSTSV